MAFVSGLLLACIWHRDRVRYLYPDLLLNEPTVPEVTTYDLVKDLIAKELTQRPVYVTDPSEAWEAWFDFVQKGSVLDSTVAVCQANGPLDRS